MFEIGDFAVGTFETLDGYLYWVIRYQGEAIPDHARIALISNDAIGNYVVITPLLELLRQTFPFATIGYFGGTRTQELWKSDDRIDEGYALFGTNPRDLVQSEVPTFDWVINVEQSPWARVASAILAGESGWVTGPCLDNEGRGNLEYGDDPRGDLARDHAWISEDLTARFPFLDSGFIGEIFCRLAYLTGPIPKYRVPTVPTESPVDVLIAMSASLPEKLWPEEKWFDLARGLREAGLTVGLLGAPPKKQANYWKGVSVEDNLVDSGLVSDLRGIFTLPEVVGALDSARHVVTLDNGIMHLAAATQTPTVGLFRPGIHRLWTPPGANLKALVPPSEFVADIEFESVLEATIGA